MSLFILGTWNYNSIPFLNNKYIFGPVMSFKIRKIIIKPDYENITSLKRFVSA